MPSLTDIASAGPWAVLAFVLISGFSGFWIAFVKEMIVPGRRLREEQARTRRLEAQVRRLTRSHAQVTRRLEAASRRLAAHDGAFSASHDAADHYP